MPSKGNLEQCICTGHIERLILCSRLQYRMHSEYYSMNRWLPMGPRVPSPWVHCLYQPVTFLL